MEKLDPVLGMYRRTWRGGFEILDFELLYGKRCGSDGKALC